MAICYLDTSAIVKRYRAEAGTEVIDEVIAGRAPEDECLTSRFTVLEVVAAVRRLEKGGLLTEETAREILRRFRQDLRELVQLWPLDNHVLHAATFLVLQRHALRAADAVHLVTALIIAMETRQDTLVLSSDHELLDAAQAEGLVAIDPQESDAARRLRRFRRQAK